MDLRRTVTAVLLAVSAATAAAQGYEPYEGQPGKDVVWVPTTRAMVDRMLDLAGVTAKDYVIDLGSGDGRLLIAAAKRGARALGVEYEADMVALARKNASDAGVADRAQFVQGDMFEADISQATALALFLLPGNLERLIPKFLALPGGTRIVTNTYRIRGWTDEEQVVMNDCITWCTAYLYIVPAKLSGVWRLPAGDLHLTQEYQTVSGVLVDADGRQVPVEGSVRGDRVRFTSRFDVYSGRVHGDRMNGEVSGASGGYWSATRLK
jgi:SAM-dependent methyltransferase